MNKLHIDFETRSELDIKKVGAYKYAKHPSTEILCMAYALNDEPVQIVKPDDSFVELGHLFRDVFDGRTIMTAFNAYFERCIFKFKMARYIYYMPSKLHEPQYWQCTMAKSSVCGLTGNLDTVCTLLGMKEHKDQAGKRVMMKMTKPRKLRKPEIPKYIPDCSWYYDKNTGVLHNITTNEKTVFYHEAPEDFETLYKYCKQDVEVERGIDRRLPRISDSEQHLWQIDQRINDTGIAVDMSRVNKAIRLMDDAKRKADTKIKYMTEFRVGAITQVAKIKAELCAGYGIYPDSLDANHIDYLLEQNIHEKAREILLLRKNNGKSSTAKYEAIRGRHCEGRVHGLFAFHLATPGRWGSYGIQVHNLPRGSIKDIDTARFAFDSEAYWMYPPMSKLLSTLIRTMFIPGREKEFAVADYTAIEARVLNWLAKQHDFVQMYADGVDTYIHMAKLIYPNTEIDGDKRFVGKTTELGSGYGMAWIRFQAQCKQFGVDVSDELAQKAIKAYRKSHKKVVKFWYAVEGMVKNAIRNPGTVYHCNGIYAKYSKSFLKLKLLSGRLLYYFRPEIDEDKNIRFWGYDSQTHQVRKQYTYGAKLVENIVQATARDILAHALTTLEGTKYKTVLHVHDEIVSEVAEATGDIDEYCQMVASLPDWAQGCPTKAEGWVGKYYKKD